MLSSLHNSASFVLQSRLSAATQGGATVLAARDTVGCLVVDAGGESVADMVTSESVGAADGSAVAGGESVADVVSFGAADGCAVGASVF